MNPQRRHQLRLRTLGLCQASATHGPALRGGLCESCYSRKFPDIITHHCPPAVWASINWAKPSRVLAIETSTSITTVNRQRLRWAKSKNT